MKTRGIGQAGSVAAVSAGARRSLVVAARLATREVGIGVPARHVDAPDARVRVAVVLMRAHLVAARAGPEGMMPARLEAVSERRSVRSPVRRAGAGAIDLPKWVAPV